MEERSDPAAQGARAAARDLAARHGPGLAAEVEAALRTAGDEPPPEGDPDPPSVASLIVAAASLARTAYAESGDDGDTRAPGRQAVTRTVTTRLRRTRTLTREDVDVVIATVDRTLTFCAPPDP